MALTLTQTAVGPLYMSGASTGTAVAFGMAGGTQVFTMDRGSPATIGTINSVYKYYAAAINFSSPAELRIDLQVSTNNTLWKDLDSMSRYIGKDTLNIKDIVGSFQFPSAAYAAPLEITAYRYLAISMRLVGVPSYDSNGTIISNATLEIGRAHV